MRRVLIFALLAATLAACSSEPEAPAAAPTKAEQVRQHLAAGNPWGTLSDAELDKRGPIICAGVGNRADAEVLRGSADYAETHSPEPSEGIPDLDRAQTLDAIKAVVEVYCPDRSGNLPW